MADARRGAFDAVIVWRFGRFARSVPATGAGAGRVSRTRYSAPFARQHQPQRRTPRMVRTSARQRSPDPKPLGGHWQADGRHKRIRIRLQADPGATPQWPSSTRRPRHNCCTATKESCGKQGPSGSDQNNRSRHKPITCQFASWAR